MGKPHFDINWKIIMPQSYESTIVRLKESTLAIRRNGGSVKPRTIPFPVFPRFPLLPFLMKPGARPYKCVDVADSSW